VKKIEFDGIDALAQSLQSLADQSYVLLKPVVDDVCSNPLTVTQNELEHIFDSVLDVAGISKKGKSLFDRLCKAFAAVYPDSVRAYIDIEREMYGEE